MNERENKENKITWRKSRCKTVEYSEGRWGLYGDRGRGEEGGIEDIASKGGGGGGEMAASQDVSAGNKVYGCSPPFLQRNRKFSLKD